MKIRTAAQFAIALVLASLPITANAGPLKAHRMFSSNMVLQREKPIVIWGWANKGDKVTVQLGSEKAEATATGDNGRWEANFPARPADVKPQNLLITSGSQEIRMENIVIGDIWVMNGQSNMALGLSKVNDSDMEIAQADLPLLREIRISPNESYELLTDLPDSAVTGWTTCTRESAGGFSAIGYAFASRVQRATGIPIGIIDNARGGASIESLVPRHKFETNPLTKRYADSVEKRRSEFDWDAAIKKLSEQKSKGGAKAPAQDPTLEATQESPENKDPQKPKLGRENLRSWDVPGRSPSDAASCYNGMFGAFKGLNIKGVVFHQGFNNQFDCRPKRYRLLMKLMIEGWREDFRDPALPVAIIAGCGSGSEIQTADNFEALSVSAPSFIREAQRLGVADLKDPQHTVFIPDYDIRSLGLHPSKKLPHGFRAARWALNTVYGKKMAWDSASLVSSERQGDVMVLTFDKKVMPEDRTKSLEGFSIADASGKFYMAHAAYQKAGKTEDPTRIHVWSPLVKEPVAVRYAWANSAPMGNLKINGQEFLPLPSFRTDTFDWPESDDPLVVADKAKLKAMSEAAAAALEFRKTEEAKHAVEILERLKTLGQVAPAK